MRFTVFSSSRTLPRHSWSSSSRITSGAKPRTGFSIWRE